MSRTHSSDARSEAASRGVTNVLIQPRQLPTVGEIEVTPASVGFKASFNTGTQYGVVESYGPSKEAAERNVLERATLFGITREDVLDRELAHTPSERWADDPCPLCDRPLGGEMIVHNKCAPRENASDDFCPEFEVGMEEFEPGDSYHAARGGAY